METERIKRIDREPEDHQLASSILGDFSIGRNKELKSFLDLLCRIEGNYSIFLDGDWGVGKTFFVKQAIMCLKTFSKSSFSEEYGIGSDRKAELESAVKPISWDDGMKQAAAYFNAWEYDYSSNPVIPLLYSLLNSFPDQSGAQAKARSTIRNLEKVMAKATSIGLGPISISGSELIEAASPDSLTESVELQEAIKRSVNEVLSGCLESRGSRVVLFIDELDRCRPEFAISVLESVKFLFSQDVLTVVFSVNAEALAKVVSARYGSGFDGARYLQRFYDQTIQLCSFDIPNYLEIMGLGNVHADNCLISCPDAHSLTMRDINRCVPMLKKVERLDSELAGTGYYSRIAMPLVVSLTYLFGVKGDGTKSLVLSGEGEAIFIDWLTKDPSFCDLLRSSQKEGFVLDTSRYQTPEDDEDPEPVVLSRLSELHRLLFVDNDETDSTRDYYLLAHRSALRRSVLKALNMTFYQ